MFLFGEICPTWRCEVVSWDTSRADWLTKVQAHGVLPPGVSEAGSARAIERERAAEQSASVIGQKSAEAI